LASMQPDEDRQLWDLLGRAVVPKVSSFFARNVVRQVRSESQSAPSRMGWSLWRVLIPATTAAVLVLGATFFLRSPSSEEMPTAVSVPAIQDSIPLESDQTGKLPTVSDQALATEADARPAALIEIDEQDYEVVQNLDDLMSTYETNLWDENSAL
jgi:hypothetical protein